MAIRIDFDEIVVSKGVTYLFRIVKQSSVSPCWISVSFSFSECTPNN